MRAIKNATYLVYYCLSNATSGYRYPQKILRTYKSFSGAKKGAIKAREKGAEDIQVFKSIGIMDGQIDILSFLSQLNKEEQ